MRRGRGRAFAATVAAGWLTACASLSDVTGPTPITERVAGVEVAPRDVTLSPGGSTTLQVTVRDEAGAVVRDRAPRWTTSNPSVATVSDAGVVAAIAVGEAQIAVSAGGRSAVAQVRVVPRPVARVDVSPGAPELQAGEVVQLAATPRDEAGTALPDRVVTWQSSDLDVVVVDPAGFVTALAPGIASITVASEGRSATVPIVVRAVPVARVEASPAVDTLVAGQSSQLSVRLSDAIGRTLRDREVRWESRATGVATVSATGLVLAQAAGTAVIDVVSEGVRDSVRVVVRPRPVGAVVVSPAQATLTVGQFLRPLVQVTDDNGAVLTGRPVTFTSANPAVVSASPDGELRALAEGTVRIEVESEGRRGGMTVTVRPTPVAQVRIGVPSSALTVGDTLALQVEALDASGQPLSGRSVEWTSGAPSLFSVTHDGVVRALGAGSGLVFARVDGRLASVTVTVLEVRVAQIELTPSSAELIVFTSRAFRAIARDASGAELTGRTVRWSSRAPAVAVVSSGGVVRAMSVGTTEVEAEIDGIVAAAQVVVIPVPVATVTVLLGATSVVMGATTQATATARDAGGSVLTGRAVAWRSSDESVATVSPEGLVTAVALGTADIIATSEGVTGTARLTVTPVPVARVDVTVPDSTLITHDTVQATATVRSADGAVLTGRAVTWTSADTTIARVDSTGRIVAVGPGAVVVTATSEGVPGSAPLQVSPAPVDSVHAQLGDSSLVIGATTTATATLRDARGNVLTGRTITWATSDASIATVDVNTGLVTAVAVGSATITATSEGVSDGVVVMVALPPVATVELGAPDSSLVVFDTVAITAVLKDASGNILTGRDIIWASSDSSRATISPLGRLVALAVGAVTITATSEGQSGTLALTIAPAPVDSVHAQLGDSSLVIGATTTATATLRDARGNVLTGRTVTWATSDAAVATVDVNTGVVTAVAVGTATITAASESAKDGVIVTVTAPPPAPVATVELSAPDSSLIVFDTVAVTAVLKDVNGTVLTGRVIDWTSSNTGVATVNANGEVAAAGVGTTTVTATSEGVSATIDFTVAPAPVDSVLAELGDSSLVIGSTTTATATLRDARSNVLTGRTVTWGTSDAAVATVDVNTGVVTAIAAGTATITGTSEGVSDGVIVTVTAPPPAPVATVELSAPDSSLIVFDTVAVTVVLKDINGTVLTGRTITWASSDSSKATISPAGQLVALDTGAVTITATSEGQSGTLAVTIALAPVASVVVTLPSATLAIGGTTTATAELKDARGNVLTGRTVAWSTSDAAVATVDPATGLVTAIAAGTATITATSEGVSNGAVVTVTPP